MAFSLKTLLILIFVFTSAFTAHSETLKVGASAVDITPEGFEVFEPGTSDPLFRNPSFKHSTPFYDTGVDRQYDFEEPGAFGPDGLPGVAGVDDDGDGIIDNCDRDQCDEYFTKGSDDVLDPHHDNYNLISNPNGTEADHVFQLLPLSGFRPYYPFKSPNRFALGVHDPIWARTLVVELKSKTLILVSTDLPGLGWKVINPIRRRIQRELSIPVENIVITSTHNHSAPDAVGYWSTLNPESNAPYLNFLKERIFSSVLQAIQTMKPATQTTVTVEPYSCFDLKTKKLKKAPDCHLPDVMSEYSEHPEAYDEWILQTDLRDPIVRNTSAVASHFKNLETGESIATFVNWHNHPDSLGGENVLISSDFPHYLRKYVEGHLGGVAVYFSGTVGNQIGNSGDSRLPLWNEQGQRVYSQVEKDHEGHPIPVFIQERGWDKIRSIGYEVASEIVKAIQNQTQSDEKVVLTVKTEPLHIPIDNFSHKEIVRSVWETGIEPEDRLFHYKGLCSGSLGCVSADVSLIQIGELSLITSPGETDPAFFLGRPEVRGYYGKWFGHKTFPAMPGVATYLPSKHKALLGQANHYLSYLIHRPDNVGFWNFKHPIYYEEMVTVSASLGDLVGNKWMQLLGRPERYSNQKIHPDPKNPVTSVIHRPKTRFLTFKKWARFLVFFLNKMYPASH